jgi:hypothetical protein
MSIGLLTSCGADNSHAVPYTKQAYTATYDRIPNKLEKKTTFKVCSDGKGHKVFIDDSRFQPITNYRRIDDHTVGREYWLDAKEKLATWTLLKNGNNFTFDEGWLKADSWVGKLTPLGDKTIDGHNCRGYLFDLRSKKEESVEYWFDKTTEVLVQAQGKTKGQVTWQVKLTSYSKDVLPNDMFMIPESYDLFEDPIGADKENANNPFEGDHSGPPL